MIVLLSLGVRLERGHRTGPAGGILQALCVKRIGNDKREAHLGRRGDFLVSALDSGSSSPGSSPGRELCGVLRQDTLLSHWLSHKVYKWIPANLILGVSLRWTSIPSRRE